jgi:antitoxin VapB
VALSIRDSETERLARALAAATGESVAIATRKAFEERLSRLPETPPAPAERLAERLAASRRRFAALPVLDPRTPDEILGYDEQSGTPS